MAAQITPATRCKPTACTTWMLATSLVAGLLARAYIQAEKTFALGLVEPVAAEGRLTTQASEGGDAGHAVDRPGILAARSRDIGLLAVEAGQDLVDAPQSLLVHALPPDRLRAATSPLTRSCTIRTLRVKPTISNHVIYMPPHVTPRSTRAGDRAPAGACVRFCKADYGATAVRT